MHVAIYIWDWGGGEFGGDFVVCMCVVHCTKSGPETGHKSCIIMFCFPGHLIYILNIHSCRLKHIFSYMTNNNKQTTNKQNTGGSSNLYHSRESR